MSNVKDYYDEVPYFSAAFTDSSPHRLNAIATFLGLAQPEISKARVLELGCAYGGNILPFAIHNPDADVFGIDISSTQVNEGNEIAKRIGVKNFKLIQKDIISLNHADLEGLGKFDYIIAHGVFSWVRSNVRDALLVLIKNLLTPTGLAYVSYNVYPGWKSLDIVRDYMVFSCQNERDNQKLLQTASAEIKFFQDYLKLNLQAQEDAVLHDTHRLVLTQLNFIRNIMKGGKNDYYILHEFLENSNEPTYFYKFAKKLEILGLSYLVEATLDDVFKSSLGIARFDRHINEHYPNRIEREQALDFMQNRSFRKSLITHSEFVGAGQEFDIGVEQISAMRVVADLELKDGVYYLKQTPLPEQFNEYFKKFAEAFPASLSFGDIANSPNDESAMHALLELIANKNALITTQNFTALHYQVGVSALKPIMREYLRYFSTTETPVISAANEINAKLDIDAFSARAALLFDGVNSFEKMAEILATDPQNIYFGDEILKFLEILERKLCAAYCFEKLG